tara:strand:+ start:258 stop:410 length:153 start_codon:yes stop_codon:yes gene_type:complete
MLNYETKSDIPKSIKQYLETVMQKTINDIDLSEANDFLNSIEDWYNQKEN